MFSNVSMEQKILAPKGINHWYAGVNGFFTYWMDILLTYMVAARKGSGFKKILFPRTLEIDQTLKDGDLILALNHGRSSRRTDIRPTIFRFIIRRLSLPISLITLWGPKEMSLGPIRFSFLVNIKERYRNILTLESKSFLSHTMGVLLSP